MMSVLIDLWLFYPVVQHIVLRSSKTCVVIEHCLYFCYFCFGGAFLFTSTQGLFQVLRLYDINMPKFTYIIHFYFQVVITNNLSTPRKLGDVLAAMPVPPYLTGNNTSMIDFLETIPYLMPEQTIPVFFFISPNDRIGP